MNSNIETVILGKKVRLSPREKAGLKGFTIGEKIAYRFFDGEYQGDCRQCSFFTPAPPMSGNG